MRRTAPDSSNQRVSAYLCHSSCPSFRFGGIVSAVLIRTRQCISTPEHIFKPCQTPPAVPPLKSCEPADSFNVDGVGMRFSIGVKTSHRKVRPAPTVMAGDEVHCQVKGLLIDRLLSAV